MSSESWKNIFWVIIKKSVREIKQANQKNVFSANLSVYFLSTAQQGLLEIWLKETFIRWPFYGVILNIDWVTQFIN